MPHGFFIGVRGFGGKVGKVLGGGALAATFPFNSTTGSDLVTDCASGTALLQFAQSALGIGDGDQLVEGGIVVTGPGGFGTGAELVIQTTNIAALTAANAAATIGSASGASAVGAKVQFAVDNGVSTGLYLFTSAGADAGISAAEQTLLTTLQGAEATVLADYLWMV